MRLLLRLSTGIPLLALLVVPTVRAAELPDDWAYRQVERPAVPVLPDSHTRVGNEIDQFLLSRLATRGLTFAPEAGRRTLIRRVYFDLIGLPPTPEQVEAFVRDSSHDAYEKVVDQLLASPQFGERMAVWWLDVVRFAETDGFKADDPRPLAWRYRDYVIKSFNADKPFHRFIQEQLAGDELFSNDPDALIATGFLRHYPDEYNAVNLEQRRQEILNDITDTTAATFLGITLGCCRCHDHKTDPIPQHDYYRMQAFFAGMWPTERPLVVGEQRDQLELSRIAWEAKTAELRGLLARIEEPYRTKESNRRRGRFAEEHSGLLDKPYEQRSPLEKQLAAMVEQQVVVLGDVSKQMKPAERDEWVMLNAKLGQLNRERPQEPPRAMVMTDLPTAPPTKLLRRGSWRSPDKEPLTPGFLSTITEADASLKPQGSTPGRRAALANWIAAPENPLTARVIANRLWQHHFGTGLVATSADLGVSGDRPTHPELLDWLASELVAKQWSLKSLHRSIVTSAAYRQSANGDTAASKADPDNKLLWQFPRRRLDGEALRDAMLAVSGRLNPKAGGPSIFPELPTELQKSAGGQWKVTPDAKERDRRSVYVFVKRNLRYPLFSLFDATDRNETCSRRFVTTTAPQALTLLNDSLVLSFAKSFGIRVIREAGNDPQKIVDRAFHLALCRPPTPIERAALLTFLKQHSGSSAEAVTDLCHALLNLNEFLYVD